MPHLSSIGHVDDVIIVAPHVRHPVVDAAIIDREEGIATTKAVAAVRVIDYIFIQVKHGSTIAPMNIINLLLLTGMLRVMKSSLLVIETICRDHGHSSKDLWQ